MDLRSKGFAISAGVVVAAALLFALRSRPASNAAGDGGSADASSPGADAGSDGGAQTFSNQVVAFDVASGKEKWRLVDDTWCDAFSSDSVYLACAHRPDRKTREDEVLAVATGKPLHGRPGTGLGKSFFSPKSTYYVQSDAVDHWSLAKADTGAAVAEIGGRLPVISPDESLVVCGHDVHALPSGEVVTTLPGNAEPQSRSFVAKNEIAETRGETDGSITVTFHDPRTGRELRHWKSPAKTAARLIAIAPTGRHLVVELPARDRGSAVGSTLLVSVAGGSSTPLAGFDTSASATFIDDGSRLVFTRRKDDKRQVIVRTLATGQETEASDEATATGRAVATGPNKRADGPPSVRVVEPGGKESRPFNDLPRRMRQHLLSPDGKTLLIHSWTH